MGNIYFGKYILVMFMNLILVVGTFRYIIFFFFYRKFLVDIRILYVMWILVF